MDGKSSAFGMSPEQIDKLLAWPLGSEAEGTPTASLEPFTEGPGGQIGRYKLLRLLGEGGMGIVYLAEQDHPIRRQVALKVIKPGMDSKRVLARFETEQQALALVEHPHVARVYDAGLAPSGRPYFVMEHVRGIPITEHCDEHRLTIEERLRLFLHVCGAVQHAHQKGIIHRDLKPSNILVMIQDQEMVPKVIDFGVARAISQPLTERTFCTEQGQLMGTPEYMSPEQADLSNQDIDTRTDVYSLGVVLYELLAGVLPFDATTFRTGGIDHIRKVICEEDPKTPSIRLSEMSVEECTESGRRRKTDIRTLRRKLRGDLDWITLKALEKDRTRRYPTVEAFAEDIRRHLGHEPVAAAPPGLVYRTGRLLRRHRQQVTAVAAILIIMTGAVVAAAMYLRADRQRAYARMLEDRQSLAEAKEQFDAGKYRAIMPSLASLIESPHVGREARLLYAQSLLEDQQLSVATTELEKLLGLEDEIAGQAHSLLATLYYQNSLFSARETPDHVDRWREHRRQAEILIGGTAQDYFLRAAAEISVKAKLLLLAEALKQDRQHYDSLREMAYIHYAQHDYETMLRAATLMMGIKPNQPQGYLLSAIALRELGRFQEALGDHQEAIRLGRNAPEAYLARWQTYTRMGRHEEALQDIRKCVEFAPEDLLHPVRLYATLTTLGQHDEAEKLYRSYIERPDLDRGFGTNLMGRESVILFFAQLTKLAFDYLETEISPYPPSQPPYGTAHLGIYYAEELYEALHRDGRRLVRQAFHPSWSPDGTKLVYAMGFAGTNAVAILDLQTGKTEMLVIPGKDPEWSPDGRHIAFVKSRSVLPPQRLASLGVEVWRLYYTPMDDGEVWVVDMQSGQMRRIAEGGYPQWGQRSGRLYYYTSHMRRMLYSISVDQKNAEPQVVLRDCSTFATVSPNEDYVADYRFREMRIINISSGQIEHRWLTPPRPRGGLFVHWSPDGQELSVCGWGGSEMGLWIYNMRARTALKVMGPYITAARWSGGDQPKLAVELGMPLTEIWLRQLKPDLPTAESFTSQETVIEHCTESIALCDRMLDIDPNYIDAHYLRTDHALWINHERSQEYLAQFGAALTPDYYSARDTRIFCDLVLSSAPEIKTRLMPMVAFLAHRVVEKEPGHARAIAWMLHRSGCIEQASAILKAYPNPQLGSSQYNSVTDAYTVLGFGMDIYDRFDDFHFTYATLRGDGSITAEIESIENVHEWTKAGVMIRGTLEPDSPNVMLLATPSAIVSFQYRRRASEVTDQIYTSSKSIQLPHWVRLTRRGDRFTARHSSDGVTWEDVLDASGQPAQIEIPMDGTVYIGLAVNSRDATRTAQARISHVTTTGSISPAGPFTESQDIPSQFPPVPDEEAGAE